MITDRERKAKFVEVLRNYATNGLMDKAADIIECLMRENETLRETADYYIEERTKWVNRGEKAERENEALRDDAEKWRSHWRHKTGHELQG